MAPDERSLQERKDSRRRIFIAFAASLALHGTFFALLFAAPSPPSGIAKSLAISVSKGSGPGGGQGENPPRGAEAAGTARGGGGVPELDKKGAEGGAAAGVAADADASAGDGAADEGATGEAAADFPDEDGTVGAMNGLAAAAGTEDANPGDETADSRAKGTGGKGSARAGGSAEGGDLVALLTAAVRAAVEERKTYPEAAKRRGTEGTVRLRFSVGEDGRLLSSKLDASSGSTILDRAALKLLASVFPVDNASRRRLEDLRISVHYGLRR